MRNVPAGADLAGFLKQAGGGLASVHTVSASGSALTVKPRLGNFWDITLTAACTISLPSAVPSGREVSVTLLLRQDATGGRSVTWPTITWLSGAEPILHSGANDVDVVILFTLDGGTTWFGTQAGSPAYTSGQELGYTEITSSLTISSTTESAGTSVFAPGALTFDGQPWICNFAAQVVGPSGGAIHFCLFEGSTEITRLVDITTVSGTYVQEVKAEYRFTPTAGSHTYTVTGFASASGGSIQAGNGGTGGHPPAFMRFVKV